jgi:hypothetical protein
MPCSTTEVLPDRTGAHQIAALLTIKKTFSPNANAQPSRQGVMVSASAVDELAAKLPVPP